MRNAPPPDRDRLLRLLGRLVTPARLAHSLAAERAARALAGTCGCDSERAALAGLLHDICRDASPRWQLQYLRRGGIQPDEAWLCHPPIWHGPCAALYLARELGIRDGDILNAVRWHTTGRAGMSGLERAVYLADATGDDRGYRGAETLRALAAADPDAAMLQSLARTLKKVARSRLPLVRETRMAYNEYSLKINSR